MIAVFMNGGPFGGDVLETDSDDFDLYVELPRMSERIAHYTLTEQRVPSILAVHEYTYVETLYAD